MVLHRVLVFWLSFYSCDPELNLNYMIARRSSNEKRGTRRIENDFHPEESRFGNTTAEKHRYCSFMPRGVKDFSQGRQCSDNAATPYSTSIVIQVLPRPWICAMTSKVVIYPFYSRSLMPCLTWVHKLDWVFMMSAVCFQWAVWMRAGCWFVKSPIYCSYLGECCSAPDRHQSPWLDMIELILEIVHMTFRYVPFLCFFMFKVSLKLYYPEEE